MNVTATCQSLPAPLPYYPYSLEQLFLGLFFSNVYSRALFMSLLDGIELNSVFAAHNSHTITDHLDPRSFVHQIRDKLARFESLYFWVYCP